MVEHAEHLQVNVPGMVDQVEEHVIFSEMMDMQGLDSVCQTQVFPDKAMEWGQCDMTPEEAQAMGSQAQDQSILGSMANQAEMITMQQTLSPPKGNASVSRVEMDLAMQQQGKELQEVL
jgi:hypothetical protein